MPSSLSRARVLRCLFVAGVSLLVLAQASQAGTYRYSNSGAREWQFRYSGQRQVIVGGNVNALWEADGVTPHTHIETYYPAPGYRTVARATGGRQLSISHRKVRKARQKCVWEWPWANGAIDGKVLLRCSTVY